MAEFTPEGVSKAVARGRKEHKTREDGAESPRLLRVLKEAQAVSAFVTARPKRARHPLPPRKSLAAAFETPIAPHGDYPSRSSWAVAMPEILPPPPLGTDCADLGRTEHS